MVVRLCIPCVARGERGALSGQQPPDHCCGDALRDICFNTLDLRSRPVVVLAPQPITDRNPEQLDVDPETRAGTAQPSGQQVGNAERSAGAQGISATLAVPPDRRSGLDGQTLEPAQAFDHRFGQAVDEIRVCRVMRQVVEIEHCDAGRRGRGMSDPARRR